MAQKRNRRTLRIMGPKESIKDLGARFKRLKKGPIGKSVSSAGEGIKKAGKWAQTRTFTGETSLFSRKQFSGGKKKTTKRKITPANENRGAEAAKEMARKRIKAGKSTLGDFGSGKDRGKLAAQDKAKKLIKQGRNTVTGEKKNKKKKKKITTWRDME